MVTFEQIVTEIKARKYRPVYLFMGDEPYYIDELTYVDRNRFA
jgi:hypothetical protein